MPKRGIARTNCGVNMLPRLELDFTLWLSDPVLARGNPINSIARMPLRKVCLHEVPRHQYTSVCSRYFAISKAGWDVQLTRSAPSCTESFARYCQTPTLIVAHNSPRRGSQFPASWLKNPLPVAQKSPSSTYALHTAYSDQKPLPTAEKGKRGTRQAASLP